MGASCRVKGRMLQITGGAMLQAAEVKAPDLRGGAALFVAALAARGTSVLQDPGHIRRGYADLAADLAQLGARCAVQCQPVRR